MPVRYEKSRRESAPLPQPPPKKKQQCLKRYQEERGEGEAAKYLGKMKRMCIGFNNREIVCYIEKSNFSVTLKIEAR